MVRGFVWVGFAALSVQLLVVGCVYGVLARLYPIDPTEWRRVRRRFATGVVAILVGSTAIVGVTTLGGLGGDYDPGLVGDVSTVGFVVLVVGYGFVTAGVVRHLRGRSIR